MPGPTGSQSGLEAGEEVKQEDGEVRSVGGRDVIVADREKAGVDNGADSQITTAAVRGRGLVPGVRGAVGGRGAAARGRGASMSRLLVPPTHSLPSLSHTRNLSSSLHTGFMPFFTIEALISQSH